MAAVCAVEKDDAREPKRPVTRINTFEDNERLGRASLPNALRMISLPTALINGIEDGQNDLTFRGLIFRPPMPALIWPPRRLGVVADNSHALSREVATQADPQHSHTIAVRLAILSVAEEYRRHCEGLFSLSLAETPPQTGKSL